MGSDTVFLHSLVQVVELMGHGIIALLALAALVALLWPDRTKPPPAYRRRKGPRAGMRLSSFPAVMPLAVFTDSSGADSVLWFLIAALVIVALVYLIRRL